MADSSVVIPFQGGLDLVTPVQLTGQGTLVDSLNYEVGPIKGYRRIDGYERFDGGPDGGTAQSIYRAQVQLDNPGVVPQPGDVIKYFDGGVSFVYVVGVVINYDAGVLDYIALDPRAKMFPTGVPAFYRLFRNDFMINYLLATAVAVDYRTIATDGDDYISAMRNAQSVARGLVDMAPSDIAGAYFGHDVAFAVCNLTAVSVAAPEELYVGQRAWLEGWPYRVARKDDTSYWLVALPGANDGSSGLITLAGPVTNWTMGTSNEQEMFAQPYIVDGSYTPIMPGLVVPYDNGTAAFGSTVRVATSPTLYTEHPVLGYSVLSGSFGSGDATGILYLGYTDFSSGFAGVYTPTPDITDTSGVVLATGSSWYIPLWAGTGAIRGDGTPLNPQTFYQWGTYNFKATSGYETVFATNGAYRAGWIAKTESGLYSFGYILTIPENSDEDKPKYQAFHADQRLALAYSNGSLQLSAVADPFNFSGLDGAVEIGNGDNITGLLEAQGDSTLVFGPRSIRRLVGSGAAIQLSTVVGDSGAMDYTAVMVSGTPVYANQNGICSLDQTSSYGDFKNSAISGAVDPWLTPRVVQRLDSPEVGGALCAMPVRAKNQYRLFLGDGSVLSMAVTTEGPQPMRTAYTSAEGGLRIPLAYSSSVSDAGHEYLLVVWDVNKSSPFGFAVDPPYANMLYRLDNGWGFDGETFLHYIDTTYLFNESPQFLSVNKAVLYGMGYGAASLRLRASGVEDDFLQSFDVTVQDISMPRNTQILYNELTRVMGQVDHANWGRAIKLRFEGLAGAGASSTEPSHILQSVRLFVQTDGITE
jgi:hypothetical protein